MNKNELIYAVYEKAGLSKRDCKLCLDAVISVIKSALSDGESVTISNFGRFKVNEFKSKPLYSFKTKTTEIRECGKSATFRPSESFKQMIK